MIQLGDKVQDTITGFTGIVVGRSEWLNGCVRFAVQSETLKDGLPQDSQWIDEPQLEVIEAGKRAIQKSQAKKGPGGPRPAPKLRPDPIR